MVQEIPDFSYDVPPEHLQRLLKFVRVLQRFYIKSGVIYPSRNCEEKYGLSEVSAHWKMPEGTTEAEIETQLNARTNAFLIDNISAKLASMGNVKQLKATNEQLNNYFFAMMARVDQFDTPFAKGIWDKLVELNPDLRDINIDPTRGDVLFKAIIGVLSQYKADDINFFLHRVTGASYDKPYDPQAYQASLEQLGKIIGRDRQWLPSPSTVEAMLTQLEAQGRGQEPAYKKAARDVVAKTRLWVRHGEAVASVQLDSLHFRHKNRGTPDTQRFDQRDGR